VANAFDQAFITAWMVSSNASEVALRLGRVMTPGEVWATVRQLRRRGLDLTRRPGGVGGGNPLILTPHPHGEHRWLDGLGRTAFQVGPEAPAVAGRRPRERVRRCVLCDRLSSGGWRFVIGPGRRRFVCNRHVTAVR
jgi:hypothetical protein